MRHFYSILTSSLLLSSLPSQAINIVLDFTYDDNNYFNSGTADSNSARAALEAAAQRWSNIIADGNLQTAEINDTNDGRIGFTNPSTGANFQVSGAANEANDSIATLSPPGGSPVGPADDYRSITFAEDEWILFAGARSLTSTAEGGTGSGINTTSTFADLNSHLNRGFYDSTPPSNSLPVWGGSIAFDTGTSFNFNGDFYTIALHEIGHALGLNINFDNFANLVTGDEFFGSNAIDALNADNGTSVTSITLADGDLHFEDNGPTDGTPDANQSFIFEPGNPDLTGTVGAGNLQDLLLEPIANFTGSESRIEVTNVDVGALEDVGWQVIPEPSSSALLGLGSLSLLLRRKR